jgi:hypothetical protein
VAFVFFLECTHKKLCVSVPLCFFKIVLSRDGVTINGFWIDYRIYWTFQHKICDYTFINHCHTKTSIPCHSFHCVAW